LFQVPQLPVLSQAGFGVKETSSQKYEATLRRQLVGRTLLLNAVLITLENCARALQQDLSHVLVGGGDDAPCVDIHTLPSTMLTMQCRLLAEKFTEALRPDAESLCSGVVCTLDAAAGQDAETSRTLYY
jgi:hypothetical protein